MKKLTTSQIRTLFLEYFNELNHEIVDSGSLVPGNDPTLLFTNAGMVPFKDVFLGREKRPYKRATTSQKSLRVSGKHNDLENVGPSPRHHTFFEMLGNFSFGDYFKKEAIQFAWHLLVEELELPIERLWFTVYTDDDEAEELWKQVGAPADRVLRFGEKDNWWAMGDIGPCGPCSEIHYYWGDLESQTPDGVNVDDEYLEIWNLVFMQYEQREKGGELIPLPRPSVDTGAGLERIASILQGYDNNYDTDAFEPLMARIQELLGQGEAERARDLTGYRVIADHSRAITFLISDGVRPGNEGREYVVRMILRRAARYGKLIGFEKPFLAKICDVVIDEYGKHYAELRENRSLILKTVTAEEERFQRTLNTGLALLDELMQELRKENKDVISGEDAFRLWGTYGFPIDITRDVAQENGFRVDEDGYDAALEADRRRSQQSARDLQTGDEIVYVDLLGSLQEQDLLPPDGVRHLIYENVAETVTEIVALLQNGEAVVEAHAGDEVELILPETPFYVESGGQVSDTGEIYFYPDDVEKPIWTVHISDVRRPLPGLIVHVGEVTSGTVKVGDPAYAVINTELRWDIMRNHTATHLLHAELREKLGEHVQQRGSLVAPDRLRFDFSHDRPLTRGELAQIEEEANAAILANYPVEQRWTTFDEAKEAGALAFFEDKYGDEVRVIAIGGEQQDEGAGSERLFYSQELCGGTHVEGTAEIGELVIVAEGSSASGVRRIEAVTGRAARRLLRERMELLNNIASELRVPIDEVERAVQNLRRQNRALQQEIETMRADQARRESESLLSRAQQVDGIAVLAEQVEVGDADTLRQMTDWFRDKLGSSVVVLGSIVDEKPLLIAAATEDVVSRGIHAGNLVREVAGVIGGRGGGRPNMAQAGGQDGERLPEALETVNGWVERNLKEQSRA